ncbi:shikimate kinase [Halocalculus aciditolerans]|nr:shikimate kinase [Halocalculus aciditolerans]
MDGRAIAPGAGTVLCALATGVGSAFAIDLDVTASVTLEPEQSSVEGRVAGDADADTSLVERCVELTVAAYGESDPGGVVETESEIPMASGLKSSSAAANATVLATLDALGRADEVSREDACRVGVRAARETGVTVTGAFDDASASMLGGVTVTNNTEDALVARDELDAHALVYTPDERAYSADADTARCQRVAGTADVVEELALAGRYGEAMTVNGWAFCAALDRQTEPMLAALPEADGVSLSGTGPSYVAIGDEDALTEIRNSWDEMTGTTRLVRTRNDGARTT